MVCDLSSESSTTEAAQKVLTRYGRGDVLVHCATVIDLMSLDALGPHSIAITAVAPGLTDNPACRVVNQNGEIEAVVRDQVIKRPLVPADTANVAAFLASDGVEAPAGQVVMVSGGAILR